MESLASQNQQSWLAWFLRGVLGVGLAVMIARSFELQIIKGNYFRSLAEENRIRKVPIAAARGDILARGGEVLVGNEEVIKTIFFDSQSGFVKQTSDQPSEDGNSIVEFIRTYPLHETAGHITGYLGHANEEEVGKVSPDCVDKGTKGNETWVGRGGLEQQYDCLLRGVDGEELVEVDTFGQKVRVLGTKPPIKGQDLRTNIDYQLQKKVSEVIKDKKGAMVVSDPYGEILAFHSSPSFDPEIFLQKSDSDLEKVQRVLSDKSLPLFNRAMSGAYHPGSVFKIVTSAAALEEGKIDKNFLYDDPGVIKVNQFEYRNWYFTQHGKLEGRIDLSRALARSTDTYFYKVGEFLGPQNLTNWASKFGFGKTTGVDIPGEVGGLVPSPEWKKMAKGENWFLGNTYHMAIGQGDITSTVLEANTMTSAIAAKGKLCRPYFNTQLESQCHDLELDSANLNLIIKGMLGACTTGGTAYPFFDFVTDNSNPEKRDIACKTGTAETEEIDKTHAWFTAFGPSEDPQIVATAIVEKGGEGSSVTAPLVREVFDYWFHKE